MRVPSVSRCSLCVPTELFEHRNTCFGVLLHMPKIMLASLFKFGVHGTVYVVGEMVVQVRKYLCRNSCEIINQVNVCFIHVYLIFNSNSIYSIVCQ